MLDGKERLVDALGRTESEAEEEAGLPGADALDLEESEDEVDAVQHQSLRPTWLLNFFNYWGSKWGAGQKKDAVLSKEEGGQTDKEDASEEVVQMSVSLPTSPAQPRMRPAARHTKTTVT